MMRSHLPAPPVVGRIILPVVPSADEASAAEAVVAAQELPVVAGAVREAGALPGEARKSSARETILDAAEAVVMADGAAHLTLDAVAERAGVSKGGLLYHFRAKETLLEALVDRHMQRFDAARLRALDALPPGAGRELKALILTARAKCAEAEKSLGTGMLAALANSPRLLAPVRAAHQRRVAWLARGEAAGLPFERTAAISLAVDGICLLEMLQVSPYDADERLRIVDELLQLVDEAVARGDHPSH